MDYTVVIDILLRYDIINVKMSKILVLEAVNGNERLEFIIRNNVIKLRALHASAKVQAIAKGFQSFIDQICEFYCVCIGEVVDDLFSSCSLNEAKLVARHDRESIPSANSSLTYGEIGYSSFIEIMRTIWVTDKQPVPSCSCYCGKCTLKQNLQNQSKSKKFYDLGSGTGKALIIASLLCEFECVVGIELLRGLFDMSLAVKEKLFSDQYAQFRSLLSEITVIHGSVVEDPCIWVDGDVIFANSTCFDADLMLQISNLAVNCRPGTILITFTKSLLYSVNSSTAATMVTRSLACNCTNCTGNASVFACDDGRDVAECPYLYYKFEIVNKMQLTMSWGPATVYIHRRLPFFCRSNDISVVQSVYYPFQFNSWNSKLNEIVKDYKQSVVYDLLLSTEGLQLEQGASAWSISNVNVDDESECSYDVVTAILPSNLTPGSFTDFVYRVSDVLRNSFGSKIPESMKFSIYCSPQYSNLNFENCPLIVYLHGGNSRGKSFEYCKSRGLLKVLGGNDKNDTNPADLCTVDAKIKHLLDDQNCVVLAPICPVGVEWSKDCISKLIIELTQMVITNLSLDKRRVYMTGGSMGGLGTYMVGAKYASMFAALVPICGGGKTVFAKLLKNMPIWFFHAKSDNVVQVSDTMALVDALRDISLPDTVRCTLYEDEDMLAVESGKSLVADWMYMHHSWDLAYRDERMWIWLFSQCKK